MVVFNSKRVALLEATRPNRHCEVCGETPATITVVKWSRTQPGTAQARAAEISRYFCDRHRNEAAARRDQLALMARAEDAVYEARGDAAALKKWFLALDSAERQVFRDIAANTLVANTVEVNRPIKFQQIDPLSFDFSDLDDELRGALRDIAFPAWETSSDN